MKLTPEIEKIALQEAEEVGLIQRKLQGTTGRQVLNFVENFLDALPNSEPVAYMHPTLKKAISVYELLNEQPEFVQQKWLLGAKLYAAPPIPQDVTFPVMLDEERAKYVAREVKYEEKLQDYKAQLVESKAREAKLNSVLCEIAASKSLTATPTQFYQHLQRVASNATFESFVATALNELIAKAGEVMRERCAIDVETNSLDYTKAEHAYSIRALPGVTLEDLNHD